MEINDKATLAKMGFDVCKVLDCNIDDEKKIIIFYLNGAFFVKNKNKKIIDSLGEGYFKLIGYESIFITSYNAIENSKTILTVENYEKLREICEIDILTDKVVIKGFAHKTANWIEFHVKGGSVKGFFVDEFPIYYPDFKNNKKTS